MAGQGVAFPFQGAVMPSEPSFPPPSPVQAFIDRDFPQPGPEPGVLSESMDVPDCLDKDILDNFPAVLHVKGDPVYQVQKPVLILVHQGIAGPLAALFEPRHQFGF